MVSVYSCIVGNRFEYQSSSPNLQVPIIKNVQFSHLPSSVLSDLHLPSSAFVTFLDMGSLVFVKINEPPLMGLRSLHIRQW